MGRTFDLEVGGVLAFEPFDLDAETARSAQAAGLRAEDDAGRAPRGTSCAERSAASKNQPSRDTDQIMPVLVRRCRDFRCSSRPRPVLLSDQPGRAAVVDLDVLRIEPDGDTGSARDLGRCKGSHAWTPTTS